MNRLNGLRILIFFGTQILISCASHDCPIVTRTFAIVSNLTSAKQKLTACTEYDHRGTTKFGKINIEIPIEAKSSVYLVNIYGRKYTQTSGFEGAPNVCGDPEPTQKTFLLTGQSFINFKLCTDMTTSEIFLIDPSDFCPAGTQLQTEESQCE